MKINKPESYENEQTRYTHTTFTILHETVTDQTSSAGERERLHGRNGEKTLVLQTNVLMNINVTIDMIS
jgi:hypothetical protein